METEEADGATIQVGVRVYATLRRHLPEAPLGHPIAVSLPAGATIGDLMDRLGIPRSETRSCFVNGRHREPDCRLSEGDDLALFPPIAGGSRSARGGRPVNAGRGAGC